MPNLPALRKLSLSDTGRLLQHPCRKEQGKEAFRFQVSAGFPSNPCSKLWEISRHDSAHSRRVP